MGVEGGQGAGEAGQAGGVSTEARGQPAGSAHPSLSTPLWGSSARVGSQVHRAEDPAEDTEVKRRHGSSKRPRQTGGREDVSSGNSETEGCGLPLAGGQTLSASRCLRVKSSDEGELTDRRKEMTGTRDPVRLKHRSRALAPAGGGDPSQGCSGMRVAGCQRCFYHIFRRSWTGRSQWTTETSHLP